MSAAALKDYAAHLLGIEERPLPSRWVQDCLVLPDGETDEPGPWSLALTPYDAEILDWWADPDSIDAAVVSPPQGGKTLVFMGGWAYTMVWDPAGALIVFPNRELARSFSESRLQKLIEANQVLADLKPAEADRFKNFSMDMRGAQIDLVNAMSIANLSSRPKRIVVQDECDKFVKPSKAESHASLQADKRTEKQNNPKRFKISSPSTEKGVIWQAFLKGDQREWHWPCPACGKGFIPETKHIKWDPAAKRKDGTWDYRLVRSSAHLVTPCCGHRIDEGQRIATSCKGWWVATNAEGCIPGYRSWRRPRIIMPWRSAQFAQIAQDFLEAKRTNNMHDFLNSVEGRPYVEHVEAVEAEVLQLRSYAFPQAIPREVLMLTAAVDVQSDRLEAEIIGWNVGLENWSIEYVIIEGDPSASQVWADLDKWLLEPRDLPIACTCVDTGGHHAEQVYSFCQARAGRKVNAVKGASKPGRPIAPRRSSIVGRIKCRLYLVGTDTAKELIQKHLRKAQKGPGYCHFPADRDREYFDQICAEEQRTRYVKGFPVKEWHKVRDRNEALDTRVYNYVALHMLGGDRHLERLAKARGIEQRIAARPPAPVSEAPAETPVQGEDSPTPPPPPPPAPEPQPAPAAAPRRAKPTRPFRQGFLHRW